MFFTFFFKIYFWQWQLCCGCLWLQLQRKVYIDPQVPLSYLQSCNSDTKIHYPLKAVVLNSGCILQSSGELWKVWMPPPSSTFCFNLFKMRSSYWYFSKCLCEILSGLWTSVVRVIFPVRPYILLLKFPPSFSACIPTRAKLSSFLPLVWNDHMGKLWDSTNHHKPCTSACMMILTETQISDVLCPSAPVNANDILLQIYVCVYIYVYIVTDSNVLFRSFRQFSKASPEVHYSGFTNVSKSVMNNVLNYVIKNIQLPYSCYI